VSKIAAALLAFISFILLAVPMSAQILPRGNVYVGASYGELDDVIPPRQSYKGWNASAEDMPFSRFPHLGFALDGSGYYRKGVDGGNIIQYDLVLGPRLSANYGKWHPFVQAMGGAQRVNSTGDIYTHLALHFGGGADYKLPFKNFSWRLQSDYIHTHYLSASQSGFRVSTGIVWRF
jgi:hypothetical protein